MVTSFCAKCSAANAQFIVNILLLVLKSKGVL